MTKGTFLGIVRSSLVHFRKSVSAIGFRHFSDQEIDALAVEIMIFLPEWSGSVGLPSSRRCRRLATHFNRGSIPEFESAKSIRCLPPDSIVLFPPTPTSAMMPSSSGIETASAPVPILGRDVYLPRKHSGQLGPFEGRLTQPKLRRYAGDPQ
jgi:hypothetical protein